MLLIENCNCQNKDQLHARERYHIDNTDCVNLNIPNQTQDELDEWNRQYHKQFYLANHASRIEYQKQYDLAHSASKHEYYLANIERIKKYHRARYEENAVEAKRCSIV